MHPSDGSCQQQTDLEIVYCLVHVGREICSGCWRWQTIAFLFTTLCQENHRVFRAVFKEKVAFVGWNHDADFMPMLNNMGRPAKQVLPVFTSGLAKNVLPVASGDHINPIPGLLVLRFIDKKRRRMIYQAKSKHPSSSPNQLPRQHTGLFRRPLFCT